MGHNVDIKFIGHQDLEAFVNKKETSLKHLSMAFLGGGQGGGKITAEFALLNYETLFYNTCNEDLKNINKLLDGRVSSTKYTTLLMNGNNKDGSYDGTAKDRELGKQIMHESMHELEKELMPNKAILNSDFVWIVVALGGGTGNGSIETITQIVSLLMRKGKRYGVKKDKDGKIINTGKPTVGIIAAIPEEDAMHKVKLNSAQALDYIKTLQDNGIVGSVLLVDNQKLIDDFLNQPDSYIQGKDWTTYGNTKVAQLVTELAALTSIDGKEVFDKSEMLDIWTTPGFLSIGKTKLRKGWVEDDSIDETQAIIDDIVKKSFKKDNVFADGYDYTQALHAGMLILKPYSDEVINSKHSLLFKKSLNTLLSDSLAKVVHYGLLNTNVFGSIKNNTKEEYATIYTMIVTKDLPERIRKMTEEALDEYKSKSSKLTSLTSKKLLMDKIDDNQTSALQGFKLADIMNDSLFNDTPTTSDESSGSEEINLSKQAAEFMV